MFSRCRPAPVLILLSLALALAAASGRADDTGLDGEHIHAGRTAEYPDLSKASDPNVVKARTLYRETKRSSARFTIREARKLGYRFLAAEKRCPGLVHMRKHATHFWGHVLAPRAPQSLLWWCSSEGKWTLVAFMYRAPGQATPPLYGGLLGWHQHAFTSRSTWMTHVWLTGDARTALATCAPFNALANHLRIVYEVYVPDVAIDAPCSDTGA
jgi:hypothetical protein